MLKIFDEVIIACREKSHKAGSELLDEERRKNVSVHSSTFSIAATGQLFCASSAKDSSVAGTSESMVSAAPLSVR